MPIMSEREQLSQGKEFLVRRERLARLRIQQMEAFPNQFRRDAFAADLHLTFGGCTGEQVAKAERYVRLAGRIMTRRVMGKSTFLTLQDMSGQIQLYYERKPLAPTRHEAVLQELDLGDIIGVAGVLFVTRSGELTVRGEEVQLLTKSLRPLPEKFHGLMDKELCYRQRYLDLLVNAKTRKVFEQRTLIIDTIREFLKGQRFTEVETPMLQSLPGGAAARPFVTHHNALDMPLYLRIAPELYLKRLVVGGLERLFEINRNFRNEGLSTRHNPEFTMLEFYMAYADYQDLMSLTEGLIRQLAERVHGVPQFESGGRTYDLRQPFRRVAMLDALYEALPNVSYPELEHLQPLGRVCDRLGVYIEPEWGVGRIQYELFERFVESTLLMPTFITQYPAEVSPLARRQTGNAFLADRFELFVNGRELANGFSELNDPDEQAACFREQLRSRASGDEEAMHYDEDYIMALEHGLPPTAGEGIGIDRLVMWLTDSKNIRDVILFPTLRPH